MGDSGFREAMEEDLAEVIFDLEEFASKHTIDGETVTVIVSEITDDNAKMSYGSTKAALNPKETAISSSGLRLYIRESEAAKLKRGRLSAEAMINLDGRRMFIESVKHNGGVIVLKLNKKQM